jgi:hypothetical protein
VLGCHAHVKLHCELLRRLRGMQRDVSAVEAMELWLSSSDASVATDAALQAALLAEGGGSHGRNYSFETLVAVCGVMCETLPPELSEIIPAPDDAFVARTIQQTFPDVNKSGIRDQEAMTSAIQAVLVSLAAAVDVLHRASSRDQ